MIEECVLQYHQECKFDDKRDGDISPEGGSAHPGCESRAQGRTRWIPVGKRYGHDWSMDDFTPVYPVGFKPGRRPGRLGE
jgi:hypothetical protein